MTTETKTTTANVKIVGQIQAAAKRTLEVFRRPGDVVEVRAINAGPPKFHRPCTVAGYFNDLDKAALNAAQLDVVANPEGIYFVLNEVNPELLARKANALAPYPKHTTSDGEIVRRRWLLIDLDPKRPSGISSTDEELDAARRMADEVKLHLSNQEWPEPVEALSGNGVHLLFPIDMANDDASRDEIRNTLLSLNAMFSSGDFAVSIDTSVFNAARITKLYGTMVRKGSNVPGRPHRQSKLIYVPDYLDSKSNEKEDEQAEESTAA